MPVWGRSRDPLQLEVEAELARLGTVPDPDAVFPIVVDKVDSRSGVARVELNGRVWNYGSFRWRGEVQEVLEALRGLPDGAGPPRVWSALSPNAPELRLWKELDRLGVTERRISESPGSYHCVGLYWNGAADVLLSDEALPQYMDGGNQVARITKRPEKFWRGTLAEALDRIEPLPDDCGLETFWTQFPDTEQPQPS
jgi:hypothetical protein